MFRVMQDLTLKQAGTKCGKSEKTIRNYEADSDLSNEKLLACLVKLDVKIKTTTEAVTTYSVKNFEYTLP